MAARDAGFPVAVKAEAPGLLHKSDIGCVRLGCRSEDAVAEAYRTVVANAGKAGFAGADALIQPMRSGVAEVFAGWCATRCSGRRWRSGSAEFSSRS